MGSTEGVRGVATRWKDPTQLQERWENWGANRSGQGIARCYLEFYLIASWRLD